MLFSQVIVNVVLSLAGIVVLFVVAMIFFDVSRPRSLALFLVAIVLSLVAVYSIGLLIAAVASTEKASTVAANLLYFPMIFLSGATIPWELLPHGLQLVARALPLTYAVDLLRRGWNGESTFGVGLDVGVLAAIAVLCVGLSVKTFKWE